MRRPLAVICGPTAIGKSRVAVDAAGALDAEILSADSMQVYRGMEIGTAKPSPEEMKGIPHHLLDLVEPQRPFSVAEYKRAVEEAIEGVWERGRLPMLVGGTGLYIHAVVDRFHFPEEGRDREVRRRLYSESKERGSEHLHRRLARVDPESADQIHPNDLRRIVRALEVHTVTGRPISGQQEKEEDPGYDLSMVGLTCSRERLYARIDRRVDSMMEQGLVEEVRRLVHEGLGPEATAMQALGYKEIRSYLSGTVTLEEAVETVKRSTRRYAKRQLTWFRRDERILWLDVDSFQTHTELVDRVVAVIGGKPGPLRE